MKPLILITALLLTLCATAMAQTPLKPEMQAFELTPVAPPTPALKYQLLFQNAYDRHTGNAANLYLEAALLTTQDEIDQADKALDKYSAGDMAGFNSMADALERPTLMREFELAGRCEDCDWQAPVRYEGVMTLLPHLNKLRAMAQIIKVSALRQSDQGKIDQAVQTLRLGYELSDKTGRETFLVSGLVSVGITNLMNDGLWQIMNRPDAPNLYWALSNFPSRKTVFRRAMDGERMWWVAPPISLADLKAGEELSANQWRELFDHMEDIVAGRFTRGSSRDRGPNPAAEAGPELMQQARAHYADAHHVTPEETANVDPIIVIGEFYFQQYDLACDEIFKLLGLPYPILLEKSGECDQYVIKLKREQPQNVFMKMVPSISRAAWTFARADRQLAAMTAVEAIRSYAAANGGNLPAKLEDVSDTPVPDNPATGLPFDYGIDGDTATLSDSQSQQTLSYTVKIRK
jgi:tetratricopeptide (TPR) repeat protein